MVTVEEIRARLEKCMELDGFEHWLEEAERRLTAYQNLKNRTRIYDVSTVGQRIRTAREIIGLTQPQLAKRIGVHQWAISNWENGRVDMPAKRLLGLCAALGVSKAWLLMESDEGGPPVPSKVLRKAPMPDFLARSNKEKHKFKLRAELDRLRGLRPPREPVE